MDPSINAYKYVSDFEKEVAKFLGSKFGVALDNCSNAIFLCCKYLGVKNVNIPKCTYPSVPSSVIHAGGTVVFDDRDWISKRFYRLDPYPIYDAAHLFQKNMCKKIANEIDGKFFVCVSFSATKPINIGKGGMILTNDENAVDWLKQARYCGRNEKPLMQDSFEILGWNMYMTPEQAARGLVLMNDTKSLRKKPMPKYPDLSQFKVYQ